MLSLPAIRCSTTSRNAMPWRVWSLSEFACEQSTVSRGGRPALGELLLHRLDLRRLVVGPAGPAAQDQVAVGVARGSDDTVAALHIDAQKRVRSPRRLHRVHRDLRVAVGAVLEADGHAETARHLAVHLALGSARADCRPRDEVGDVLRHDGVEELSRRQQSPLGDMDEQLARSVESARDVERAVEVRVVDEPLPPQGGARLLEVDPHHDEHTVGDGLGERREPIGILERGRFVVNRDKGPIVISIRGSSPRRMSWTRRLPSITVSAAFGVIGRLCCSSSGGTSGSTFSMFKSFVDCVTTHSPLSRSKA